MHQIHELMTSIILSNDAQPGLIAYLLE